MARPIRTPLEVVWEDPPNVPKTTPFSEVIEQLKMRPNTWARIRTTQTKGGAYSTRKGLLRAANGSTIETQFVETDENVHTYAKYVPKGRS